MLMHNKFLDNARIVDGHQALLLQSGEQGAALLLDHTHGRTQTGMEEMIAVYLEAQQEC